MGYKTAVKTQMYYFLYMFYFSKRLKISIAIKSLKRINILELRQGFSSTLYCSSGFPINNIVLIAIHLNWNSCRR